MIDDRDQPFIKNRILPESVTFLGNGNQSEKNRSLYAIPGLDYVAHEDVIPYKSKDKAPIHHELFDKFLGEIMMFLILSLDFETLKNNHGHINFLHIFYL